MARIRAMAAVISLVVAAEPPLLAFAPSAPGSLSALYRQGSSLVPIQDPAAQLRMVAGSPGVAQLERESGGTWVVEFDLATGRLRRAFGAGIPLLPGVASGITGPERPSRELIESTGRAFIEAHASLFGIDPAELAFLAEASVSLTSVPVTPIQFERVIGGVRLEPSQIQLVVNRGNLIYINAVGLEPVETSPIPTLEESATWQTVVREAAALGVSLGEVERVGKPELVLRRRQDSPESPFYARLLRLHTFRLPGEHETWRAGVDAHDGQLIEFGDENSYACSLDPTKLQGQVRGGIRPAQATDAEEVRNFPYTLLRDDGQNETSDYNGYYFYSGKDASSGLQGSFFKTNCQGCSNPPQASCATTTDGLLDFGIGGADQNGNGRSTPAERTAFYHENVARAIAAKWITRPWFATNVGVNVNIADVCNAFWNGSTLNFYRSGGGCANTGEIRDVMQHEWGHGLDSNDGRPSVDRAMGEAYGDMIALFVDHDSCIGQSFFTQNSGPYCHTIPDCTTTSTCTGVRNTDEKRASRGLMTMTTALSKCGPASCGPTPPPLSRQCHCEGEIFGQAAFHLSNNLLTGNAYDTGNPLAAGNPAFSDVAAWFIHERDFFNGALLFSSYAPSHRQSFGTGAYDAYMTIDDDDGNLANGTPNAEYINQAFVHHEIHETTLVVDSANCAPPPDPVYSVTPLMDPTTGNAQVRLSWPDVNASFYVVYRNYRQSDVWLPVRNQVLDDNRPVYDIFDEPVEIGKTYNYAVLAVSANGCPSPGANRQSVSVALPDPTVLIGQVLDPAPGGDGDGIPEPGERVGIRVDLKEVAGLVGLTGAEIALSTTDPLAVVTQPGPIVYGNVLPLATVNGPSNFEVGISTSHGCGTNVPLIAAISSDSACALRALAIQIPSTGCVPAPRAEAVASALTISADNGSSCSDGDNVPDNGELVTLDVTIDNPGTATANNVSVTLSSANTNFAIMSANPVTIPSLAPLATVSALFQLEATAATCMEPATLNVVVDSDENLFPIATSRTLALEEDRPVASLGTGFEADFGLWTANGFVRQTFRKNAGNYSAFAGPTPQPHVCDDRSSDGANACATLTSPKFVAGPSCQFRLSTWYQLEPWNTQYFDRANVHVIDAQGAHVLVRPAAGKAYIGGNGENSGMCHVDNEDGWTGNAAAGQAWGTSTFDLSAWSGEEIQLEINYNTDSGAICEGFYIDDLSVADARTRACDALNCNSNVPNVTVAACGSADLCASSSQSDGVVDPGEEVTFTIDLENTGTADAVDVRGDVTVVGGGTIISGGAIGGTPQLDIPAASISQHVVVVRVTGSCSQTLDVDVENLRAGTSVFAAARTACDRSIGANQPAGTVNLDDLAGDAPIPETNQPPYLERTVTNPVPVAVTTATIAINVTHPRISDLAAWVNGPGGGQVVTTSALNATMDVTAFVNTEGPGDYTLFLVDSKRGSVGSLANWSITMEVPAYSSCNACASGCTAPAFSISGSSAQVCRGNSLAFTSNFTSPGSGLFDYQWDFGDGSPIEVVSNPGATIVHAFAGPGPSYTVRFTAISRSSGTCDASAQTVVTIDNGTLPTGGPIGNRLRAARKGLGASLDWSGSGITPARFTVYRAGSKLELAETPSGIGDEPMLGHPTVERFLDPGALAVNPPNVGFYQVIPEDSCGRSIFP